MFVIVGEGFGVDVWVLDGQGVIVEVSVGLGTGVWVGIAVTVLVAIRPGLNVLHPVTLLTREMMMTISRNLHFALMSMLPISF